MCEKNISRVIFLSQSLHKKNMVCFTGDPIYNNVLYEEDYDDDMPALEYPEEYPEEDEVIINPAEEDYNEEASEEVVGQRRMRRDDDERQPNDYEDYLEEMLEYYNERQSVLFPTTFDLPPQLSRGGGEPNGRPRQRQQQLLSEILYENLRVMFSNDNN